jgi:hypothetical protein
MSTAAIARLKITLDEVRPLGMRRLEVPLSIRLDRLHLAIQAAMGWTNSHLYEIRAKDTGWGIPDPDWGDGPLDARKARLIDVLEDVGAKTLKYLYDSGDGWEHTIKVERLIDPLPGMAYPRLLEAAGRVHPKMSAVPGAMLSSSKPSGIPITTVMPSSKSGMPMTSIPTSSMPAASANKSPRSLSAGHER